MSFFKNVFRPKKEAASASFPSDQIYAPAEGTIVRPADLNDPVFSAELMGPTLAIEPVSGNIYAPAAGKISMIYPTGHAFGITTSDGAEILIHIGIDTVSLDGKGFTVLKKQGQSVTPEDLVVTFDPEVVKNAGLRITTMTILTNPDHFTLQMLKNYGAQASAREAVASLKRTV